MTDSLQVIHDTIYIKGADALDILQTTNQFYESAWDRIFSYSVALITLFGFILPVAATLYQKRLIRIDRLELEKKINDDVSNAKSLMEELKKQVKLTDTRMKGSVHLMNAQLLVLNPKNTDVPGALLHNLRAAWYFVDCAEYSNAIISLSIAKEMCKGVTKSQITSAKYKQIVSSKSVEDVIAEISRMDSNGALNNALIEFSEAYSNLPQ